MFLKSRGWPLKFRPSPLNFIPPLPLRGMDVESEGEFRWTIFLQGIVRFALHFARWGEVTIRWLQLHGSMMVCRYEQRSVLRR